MVIAVVAGVLGGYWGQPWIHENERAINVIVTSFSILAGFLIAIRTIIGDPAIFFWRSWRGYDRRPSGLGSAELKREREEWRRPRLTAAPGVFPAASHRSTTSCRTWIPSGVGELLQAGYTDLTQSDPSLSQ